MVVVDVPALPDVAVSLAPAIHGTINILHICGDVNIYRVDCTVGGGTSSGRHDVSDGPAASLRRKKWKKEDG